MKGALHILWIILLFAFSVWLLRNSKASEPDSLSSAHADINDCEQCHVPWKGVSDARCMQCHEFDDVSELPQEIRFHEAGKHCLKWHVEHRGPRADISKINHNLFHGDLECTQCHFDPHKGLFGQDCRECHRISTWSIEGYRHPPEERGSCDRCHGAPDSHYDKYLWALIEERYLKEKGVAGPVSVRDCSFCHFASPRGWRHLRFDS